jgi:lipopolysaccharide export system permease protein
VGQFRHICIGLHHLWQSAAPGYLWPQSFGTDCCLLPLHRTTSLLLLRSFLAPLVVTFPVALFILDMQFLWVYADDLIGKGVPPLIIGELMWYASARLVNLALPLAILVAALMALGNLAERNELTALKSSGMSLGQIFRPYVLLMACVAFGALQFSNVAWPAANLKFRALLFSVSRKKPTLNLQPGIFYTGIDGVAIRVDGKDDAGGLTDILIHDYREASYGSSRVIRAEKGSMHQDANLLVLTLENGASYEDHSEQNARRKERLHPHVTATFERQVLQIDMTSLDFSQVDEALFQRVHEMMSLRELTVAMDSLEAEAAARYGDVQAFGARMATPLRDSLSTPADPALAVPWNQGLDRTKQRMAFEAARDLCRNGRLGVENSMLDARNRLRLKDRHAIEWHRKWFLSSSCLLLFFIGAPLGAVIRKGGMGMPAVWGIGIFLAYYILSIVGEQMVKSGNLSPALGMWLSTLLLVPVAAGLLRAAHQDARLADLGTGLRKTWGWVRKSRTA